MKMVKNIMIFGANGGLGREILNNLINKNFHFYLSVKNSEAKSKVLQKLNAIQKKKIKFFEICDFTNNDSINFFFKILKKKHYNIDIVFNCTGFFDYNKANKLDLNKLLLIFQINLFSSIIITSNLSHMYNKKKLLKIFHIGSSSAYEGFANTSYYCSAKHGLVGAIKSMNKETIKNNIINYLVSMGSMKTKMGRKVKNQDYRNFLDTKKVSEFIINLAFSKINGYTEEILIKRFIN